MSLMIHWQSSVQGPKLELSVPFLGAELIATMIHGTIVATRWQLQAKSQPQIPTVLTQQIRVFLLHPSQVQLKLELLQQGTAYRRKVWCALGLIPFGQTVTYSDLAMQLGTGARAVAQACRNNPYPGIIPCHRVIAKSGIGGFMGQTQGGFVKFKQQLLDYERTTAMRS